MYSNSSRINTIIASINKSLLIEAFSHKSLLRDNESAKTYERLEYLGDGVLKLVFVDYLFSRFPEQEEGILTKYSANLIADKTLAKLSKKFALEKNLKVGQSLLSQQSQKHLPDSIIGDIVEALIGAIYKQYGFAQARNFIFELWDDEFINSCINSAQVDNYKEQLNEFFQSKYKQAPEYIIVETSGLQHNLIHTVAVLLSGRELARANAKTKKEAGQKAAKKVLEYYQANGNKI